MDSSVLRERQLGLLPSLEDTWVIKLAWPTNRNASLDTPVKVPLDQPR